MAEDWVKDAHSEAKAEFNARSEVEKESQACFFFFHYLSLYTLFCLHTVAYTREFV